MIDVDGRTVESQHLRRSPQLRYCLTCGASPRQGCTDMNSRALGPLPQGMFHAARIRSAEEGARNER